MKLVHNWRSFWRWHSVQLAALAAVLPLVWMEIPPDLKAYIPPEWRPYIVSLVALSAAIGRLRDQGRGS